MCNFKTTNRLFVVLLLIFLVIGWKAKTAQTQSTADKPVEQVRKNIQVLKGLPDSQLFLLMNFVGDSLGVNCDHCPFKTHQAVSLGVRSPVVEDNLCATIFEPSFYAPSPLRFAGTPRSF